MVLDTRTIKDAAIVRRRRQCEKCRHKFTTYERLEEVPLLVVKSDQRREPLNPAKMREGILRAVEKRPVSSEVVERIVAEVQQELSAKFALEVSSREIGRRILEKLFGVDPVAYVRFASVYNQYDSIDTFAAEIRAIKRAIEKRGNRRTGGLAPDRGSRSTNDDSQENGHGRA